MLDAIANFISGSFDWILKLWESNWLYLLIGFAIVLFIVLTQNL